MDARPRPRDRGAAAVETALVLPLLLMLVFGIIDFGRLLNAQLTVSAAAREGARAAAIGGSPSARVNQIMGDLPGGIDTGESHGCVTNPGVTDDAVVVVQADFDFVTPFSVLADLSFNGQLSATGVTPCRV